MDAVGVDAARYALARSSADSQIDIDLDLLAKRSNDNPVYYVQYAHARAAGDRPQRRGRRGPDRPTGSTRRCSTTTTESLLLAALGEFPRVVAQAAELREPHRVARYLEELAGTFHKLVRRLPGPRRQRRRAGRPTCTGPGSGSTRRPGRCSRNGLGLLGVSAPERM